MELLDVVIVGAGPAGLACALDASRRGLEYVVLEKGTAVNSIVGFPPSMVFFSTAQNLELDPMPFTSTRARPTREEVIEYYLGVIRKGSLRLRLGTTVLGIGAVEDRTLVVSTDRGDVRARHVVLATGYFDNVNMLGVPGEELPKVRHYYHEPYPHFDQDVLVIGGRNSAAETALDLWRHGARVTLAHRGDGFGSVKYWILPDIENRIREGSITALWRTSVERIDEATVTLRDAEGGVRTIANDAVYAMIGYRPDAALFGACGLAFDPDTLVPEFDPETLESSVANLFIAGSVACGCRTWEIFIENGKEHAARVIAEIARRLDRAA